MFISDWTSLAETDDELVAILLLNLKHSIQSSDPSSSSSGSGSLPMFRWGRRKTRSRHAAMTGFGICMKRAIRSPTTPLSWSGSETSSLGSPRFRSKNYVELKEEEGSLLQERQELIRDLATMHVTMAHHRNANNNLKIVKRVNVHSKQTNNSNGTEISTLQDVSSTFTKYALGYDIQPLAHASTFGGDSAPKGRESFLLPDLNMLPSIDEEPFQQR